MKKQSLWVWVEGERVNARGDSSWQPLYCSRSVLAAKGILRNLLGDDKFHNDFDDFRVVRPEEVCAFRKRSKDVARWSDGKRLLPICPACTSAEVGKVKRGESLLYKCLSCSKRWPRGVSAPVRRPRRSAQARVDGISKALHAKPLASVPPTKPLETPRRPKRASARIRRS